MLRVVKMQMCSRAGARAVDLTQKARQVVARKKKKGGKKKLLALSTLRALWGDASKVGIVAPPRGRAAQGGRSK